MTINYNFYNYSRASPLEFYNAGALGPVAPTPENGLQSRERNLPKRTSASNYLPKEIPLVTSASCLQVYGYSLSLSSVMSTSVEDRVANRVLQKCSQAIVDHINVDEVTYVCTPKAG